MSGFMHVEDDPDRQGVAMVQLQSIVDRIAGEYAGKGDPVGIQRVLSTAIEDAGLPEQPQKWVGDAAGEIAAGRTVVVDRSVESVPMLAASEFRSPADEPED